MEILLSSLNELPAAAGFSILLAVFGIVSFALRWVWKKILIRLARKTSTNLDRLIFESTGGAAQIAFIAAGFDFSWNLYGDVIVNSFSGIKTLDTEFIGKLADHFCFLFLFFSLVVLIWKTIIAIVDWYEKDIASKTETKLDEKIVHSVRKVMKVFLFVFIIMTVADHFDLPISKVWAMAGIGSLAVALAAKDTFANMISGVIILFDRPFLVGDRIELADGTFGDVVDIGLRSTKILSFDNTIHIIPNAELSNQRITNHTYPDIKLKVAQTIGVAYGSNMEKVKDILNGILRDSPDVLNDPPWGVWFKEFGDSSLNLFMRYWISDYTNKFTIIDGINMEIHRRFGEENIEIPFPQRDVHIIKGNGE